MPTFDAVRYVWNVSDLSTVTMDLSEMPEIYLVVGDYAYMADSSGYLMMCPKETIVSLSTEMVGDGQYQAINTKYADESEFGALVPEEMIVRNEVVAAALTALHDMHR